MSKIILNLSSVDYGGAGKFAVDLDELLKSAGYESYLVVKDSKTDNQNVIKYHKNVFEKTYNKIQKTINKLILKEDNFDDDYHFYNKYERFSTVISSRILKLLPKMPDIIFLYWVSDFINAQIINELKQITKAKIFWLLIDNSPLTGGCHYPWGCKGYTKDCSECPAITNKKHGEVAKKNLLFKKKQLPSDINILAFSSTDYERTKESILFRDKNIVKLVGYVNEEIFRPGDKNEAQNYFKLEEDKKVILFGAASINNRRKGISILKEALQKIEHNNFQLLIVGNVEITISNYKIKNIGYLSKTDLIKAYQAADVFICASIEDSGPIMINQSLMCGTPVVAFNVGVANDIVITNITGYKAYTRDPDDLAKGVLSVLNLSEEETVQLSARCREFAVSTYGKKSMLDMLNDLLQ